jgi:hypothetical protein
MKSSEELARELIDSILIGGSMNDDIKKVAKLLDQVHDDAVEECGRKMDEIADKSCLDCLCYSHAADEIYKLKRGGR